MKKETQVNLERYTTFHMGGIADKMYIPESEEELLQLVKETSPKYFIGGGSNLIIKERVFDIVVNLRQFSNQIKPLGEGEFLVGASVRLQNLILTINEQGYGGIEYLFSVPGLVGGATVMNAGRGKEYNACISDYIMKVKVLYKNEVKWLTKEECQFSYRNSVFKNEDYLVLEVKYKFPAMSIEETTKKRNERIKYCKLVQDTSAPNFGTVFCEADKRIMFLVKKLPIRKCNGISYSEKTSNWMLNKGGTFEDVMTLLNRVKKLHRLLRKECKMEAVLWE